MSPSRRRLLVASCAAVALPGACGLLGLSALAGCQPAAPRVHFNSVDLTGAEYAHQFDLPDFDGKRRTLADFKGKVTAVFFGYTQCPDACPTTMAELAAVAKSLGPDADRLQVVFITVDPARDTAPLLKNYVTNFRPDFLALRGDDAQTQAVAREFKVFYAKVPGRTDNDYSIDHTAGTYIFDKKGRIRLFARENMEPGLLTADVKALLAETA